MAVLKHSRLDALDRPSGLEHSLSGFFPQLGEFQSTRQLHRSTLFKKLEPEINRVLNTVVQENLAPDRSDSAAYIRAAAWNIERGSQLAGIIELLQRHPRLRKSDVLLLTELDYGMARSGNHFIAREIAGSLGLNYAYANCYMSLVKGSGLEYDVRGDNTLALHGNALFSRHPMRHVRALPLPNGKDKMRGKEKRLGRQQAVLAMIDHPSGPFWAVSLHLDAHSSQRHRSRQMRIVLDHLDTLNPSLPVLLGGDWNTSTYNSRRATYSILGYVRRVLMGVRNVIENHYPHPDRWFERHLFRELTKKGYDYESLNETGACTLHYDVDDLAVNTNMADWIPQWCFWFINWALKRQGGSCSMKLDWFAGRGIQAEPVHPPLVVGDAHPEDRLLSDHDPIALDFHLAQPN